MDHALDVCAAHDVPPVLTHSPLGSIRDDEFGITVDQLGGLFSTSLNQRSQALSPTSQSVESASQ